MRVRRLEKVAGHDSGTAFLLDLDGHEYLSSGRFAVFVWVP